jgi:hypothetical protein
MKTFELQGAALDWAVAQCEGYETLMCRGKLETLFTENGWTPSTNWEQGGVIIEKEKISIEYMAGAGDAGVDVWVATMTFPDKEFGGVAFSEEEGPTPLIAVMRCYVASKMGYEVDVPEDLLQVA